MRLSRYTAKDQIKQINSDLRWENNGLKHTKREKQIPVYQSRRFCSPMWTAKLKCQQVRADHRSRRRQIKEYQQIRGRIQSRDWVDRQNKALGAGIIVIGQTGRAGRHAREAWAIKQDHTTTDKQAGTGTCTQTEGWRGWNQSSRRTAKSATMITWRICDMVEVKVRTEKLLHRRDFER